MKCTCAPRSLSINPRCPIHANAATNAERMRYGMEPRPHYCPRYGGECARRECAIECQGRGHTSGVAASQNGSPAQSQQRNGGTK